MQKLVRTLFSPSDELRTTINVTSKKRNIGYAVAALTLAVAVGIGVLHVPFMVLVVGVLIASLVCYLGLNNETRVAEIASAARVALFGMVDKPPQTERVRLKKYLDLMIIPRVGSLVFVAFCTMLASRYWSDLDWGCFVVGPILVALCAWIGTFLPLTAASLSRGYRHRWNSIWHGKLGIIVVGVSSLLTASCMTLAAYWMWHFDGLSSSAGDRSSLGAFAGLAVAGFVTFYGLFLGLGSDTLADTRRERWVLLIQCGLFTLWCVRLSGVERSGTDVRESFVWTTTTGLLQGAAALVFLFPIYQVLRPEPSTVTNSASTRPE